MSLIPITQKTTVCIVDCGKEVCSCKPVKSFNYCQSQIEDRKKCTEQCDHCMGYYKPLEDKKK